VPLSAGVVRELRAHRLASPWSDDARPVFASRVGSYLLPRNCYRWYTPAVRAAALQGRTGFHVLRHTAASAWLQAGLTVVQVAALLGHADPGLTLRVYAHAMPAHRPSGEALAAAVLGGPA
jgi:integrase